MKRFILAIALITAFAFQANACETFDLTFSNFTKHKVFVGVADLNGNVIDQFILEPGCEKTVKNLEFAEHFIMLADDKGGRDILKLKPLDCKARLIFYGKNSSRI